MARDMSFAAETTTDSDYANQRNFFKVELWTKDDQHVIRLLHAGNRIDAARAVLCGSQAPAARATQSASGVVWLRSGPTRTLIRRKKASAQRLKLCRGTQVCGDAFAPTIVDESETCLN
jgi:hypothetical protein